MGSKYIAVPADALNRTLAAISEKVHKAGGRCNTGRAGHEVVFELTPPNAAATLRVYSSLGLGEDSVRGCGEDAVRLVVGWEDGTKWRPLGKSRRIYRTAPQGPHEERVQAFLDRLTQALREGYAEAARHPVCHDCGRPMQLRTNTVTGNQFWGCCGYPECKKTFNYTPPQQ
jgi:hypothetical protein